MTFKMYPDVIDASTISYQAAYAIDVIRKELAKRKPNMRLCAVLLNGDKYNEIPL